MSVDESLDAINRVPANFTIILDDKSVDAINRVPTSIGGTVIRAGDLVIADDDVVVIWPQERIDLAQLQGKK